jgi:hypothetical protein
VHTVFNFGFRSCYNNNNNNKYFEPENYGQSAISCDRDAMDSRKTTIAKDNRLRAVFNDDRIASAKFVDNHFSEREHLLTRFES